MALFTLGSDSIQDPFPRSDSSVRIKSRKTTLGSHLFIRILINWYLRLDRCQSQLEKIEGSPFSTETGG